MSTIEIRLDGEVRHAGMAIGRVEWTTPAPWEFEGEFSNGDDDDYTEDLKQRVRTLNATNSTIRAENAALRAEIVKLKARAA